MHLKIKSIPNQRVSSNQTPVAEMNIIIKFVCSNGIEFIVNNFRKSPNLEFEDFLRRPEVEKG